MNRGSVNGTGGRVGPKLGRGLGIAVLGGCTQRGEERGGEKAKEVSRGRLIIL